MKDWYSKLTLFKVSVHFYKSDEKSNMINEILSLKQKKIKNKKLESIVGPN